jgi:hypothetical protein
MGHTSFFLAYFGGKWVIPAFVLAYFGGILVIPAFVSAYLVVCGGLY